MSVRVRSCERGHEVDIRWRAVDGRFHRTRLRLSLSSKSAAQRWGELHEQKLIQQAAMPVPPAKKEVPTLQEFAPRFIREHAVANQLKPSGIAHKEIILRVHLVPALGSRRLDAISNADVQQLKYRLHGKSPTTVNNALTVLNTLLKDAIDWKVIGEMPCQITFLKKAPAKTKLFDFEQYERLVKVAALRSRATLVLVLLAGDAGLRAGEIRALEWSDVDFSLAQITVRQGEWHGQVTSTKGNKIRVVPMTNRLSAALKEHRHLRGRLVLCRENGAPMAEHHVEELLRGALRVAGLSGSPHVLRHTFCSHAIATGLSFKEVQALAGHENLETLERYVHSIPGALHPAIERLDLGRRQKLGEIRETPEALPCKLVSEKQ